MADKTHAPTHATTAGTATYRARFADMLDEGHFRKSSDLWFSSIGIGTYLGDSDAATDRLYSRAVLEALKRGCNVIDTAINYRNQRSERAVGEAIRDAIKQGITSREEIIVATKGGYLPFDGEVPPDPAAYVEKRFIKTGLAAHSDIVEWNCMTPLFIDDQFELSLKNLGLDCLDIYYLHNPESQLEQLTRDEFYGRIRTAFIVLEKKVADGKLRSYGMATWNGFRRDPDAYDYLNLAEILDVAEDAVGKKHHFKAVQLPYNLAMTEALTKRNQEVDGKWMSFLEAAVKLDITVMTSVATMQGQLTKSLPPVVGETLGGLTGDAQRAIQFARSAPGVTTALVGMKRKEHVIDSIETAIVPPAKTEDLLKLFTQA